MNNYFILLGIISSSLISAQVGVNTQNPQNTFHIDGGKDNNVSGAPTSTQQQNDVIITSGGNIGVGVTSPTTRLEINNGTTNGALKIVDGTQGINRVLMSDANGVGTWRTPASIKPTVIGFFPGSQSTTAADGGSTPKYTGVYIDLTQGRWIVNTGLTISNNSGLRHWQHCYLSTSTTVVQQTGFTHLGPSGTLTSYAGEMTQFGTSGLDNTLNFLSGSSVVEVNVATLRVYLLIENKPTSYWSYSTGAQENYFYAIPIN